MRKHTATRSKSLSAPKKLEILSEIGTAVISAPLPEVLRLIVDAAVCLTSTDEGTVFLLDYAGDELFQLAHSRPQTPGAEAVRIRVGGAAEPLSACITGRAPVKVEGGVLYAAGRKAMSLVSVPILFNNCPLGVLCVCRTRAGRKFTRQDEFFLLSLASHAAVAIEGHRQREEERRNTQALSDLYQVGPVNASDQDLSRLLDCIAESAAKVAGSDMVVLYAADEERPDVQVPPATYGKIEHRNVLEGRSVASRHETSMVFQILLRENPFYAEDAQRDWMEFYPEESALKGSFLAREGICSSVAVPLRAENQPVGVLFLNFRTSQVFPDERRQRIELFTRQAALILSNARRHQRYLKNLEILNEIGSTIGSSVPHGVEAICRIVHSHTKRLMDATDFVVSLYDELGGIFRIRYQGGEHQLAEIATGDLHDLCENIRQTAQQGFPIQGAEEKTWLGAPLAARKGFLGVVAVQRGTSTLSYTKEHKALLSAIAAQTAVALDNSLSLSAAKQQIEELSALYDTSQDVAVQQLSPEELLEAVLQRAVKVCDADGALLLRYDPISREVSPVRSYGLPIPQERRIRLGEGLIGKVAEFETGTIENHYQGSAAQELDFGNVDFLDKLSAAIGVPVLWEGRLLGVLLLSARMTRRDFGRDTLQTLERFARTAAIVLHNVSRAAIRHALVEAGPQAIIAIGPDGLVTEFNASCARLLGLDQADVLRRPVTNLYWRGIPEAKRIKALLRKERTIKYEPTELRGAQGRVPALLSAALLTDRDEQEIGSVGIVEDVRIEPENDSVRRLLGALASLNDPGELKALLQQQGW